MATDAPCSRHGQIQLHLSAQMLERVLADLDQRCNSSQDLPSLAVVRLSGLVHAEERTAFQDIARQLCQ